MARQASEDTHHPFPGFFEWYEKWLEERARYPSFMIMWINEHPKQNEQVSVIVFPHMDRRDSESLRCYEDPRYRGKGYEIPMCIFNELLSEETVGHLNTILSPIRQQQGVDHRQALAFSVQIFLMFIDYQRAKQGEESVLFGPTSEQFLHTPEGKKRLLQLSNRPLWTLKALFKFWGYIGVYLTPGFYTSPDGSPGQPNYLQIPPTWLTDDKFEEIYGDDAETRRIPILVEPTYKAPMESFLGFYRVNRQAGVPLHLSLGVSGRGDQVRNIGDQAPVQRVLPARAI